MITNSTFVQHAPRPDSLTQTDPSVCRIVYSDGSASQWFLTKAKGIQFIEAALEVGAITTDEEIVLKLQVLENNALYAGHPNIDEAVALIQEANGDDNEVLFAIFIECKEPDDEPFEDSSTRVALAS